MDFERGGRVRGGRRGRGGRGDERGAGRGHAGRGGEHGPPPEASGEYHPPQQQPQVQQPALQRLPWGRGRGGRFGERGTRRGHRSRGGEHGPPPEASGEYHPPQQQPQVQQPALIRLPWGPPRRGRGGRFGERGTRRGHHGPPPEASGEYQPLQQQPQVQQPALPRPPWGPQQPPSMQVPPQGTSTLRLRGGFESAPLRPRSEEPKPGPSLEVAEWSPQAALTKKMQTHTLEEKKQPERKRERGRQAVCEEPSAKSEGREQEPKAEKSPETKESQPKVYKQIPPAADALIPKRKGVGTSGRRVTVEVNFFNMKLNKMKETIYHYDVTFKPDAPKRLFTKAMDKMREEVYPDRYPAFDGRRNLYACEPLPLPDGDTYTGSFAVNDDESGREKNFEICIQLVNQVPMSMIQEFFEGRRPTPQVALQAIDIALRAGPMLRMTYASRSFFTPQTGPVLAELGEGLELWRGHFQSAILGWKPFFNVDVAHKGFPIEQKVLDYMRKEYKDNDFQKELPRGCVDRLEKFMKGLKVVYEIPGRADTRRVYRVNKLGSSPNTNIFEMEVNGQRQEITVAEYFRTQKRYPLEYPNLPCLHVGSQQRNVHVPVELCSIKRGQVINEKLTERQTAQMVRAAARPPEERKQNILNAMENANFREDPYAREFGVEIGDRFIQVDARELPAPTLQYGQGGGRVNPQRGVWRMDNKKFYEGRVLKKWMIINLKTGLRDYQIRQLAETLTQAGNTLGVTITSPPETYNIDVNELKNLLERKKDYDIAFIVLPNRSGVYSMVKRIAEIDVGFMTQCIKEFTVSKKVNVSTAQNIMLKVNTKLKGMNHVLAQSTRPAILKDAMIVGADVTHPSPDQTRIPSIAAVTASFDDFAYRYHVEYRLQPPRLEIIERLDDIILNMLELFKEKNNGRIPRRIVFYRDGVSEGQFAEVLNRELTAIREACRKFSQNYEPKITMLVVRKRHHTRFFPLEKGHMEGKCKNVMPGTVVDTEITHPTELDFYLVSHASIQGTARPTKYHLLWDDSSLSTDEIETLTNHLCYIFARCNRAVSYPAPTYYAHYVAFRARAYMLSRRDLTDEDIEHLDTETHCGIVKSEISKENPMFFV